MKKAVGKILTGFLIVVMVVLGVIVGSMLFTVIKGDSPRQKADGVQASNPVSEEKDPVEVVTDSAPTKQPADDEKPQRAANLGDYYVEIKGAELTTDYDGDPAIVVTYTWTNNSENTTCAMVSVVERAFQDGIELDSALIFDSDIYDSGLSSKEIRPGYSLDVQAAFTLTSTTSVVEFELSELISLRKDMAYAEFDPAAIG